MNQATGHAALLRPSNRRWLPVSANTGAEEWQDLFAPETNEAERLEILRVLPIRSYHEGADTQTKPVHYTVTFPPFHSLFNPGQALVFKDTCQSAATMTEDLYDVPTGTSEIYSAVLEQSLRGSDTRNTLGMLSVPAILILAARGSIQHDIRSTVLEKLVPARDTKINKSVLGGDSLLRISTSKIYPELALFYGTGITLTLSGLGWFILQFIEAGKSASTFFSRGEALLGICGMAWLALELILALRADSSTKQ
ncbi:MAG: hypothetical protein Q7U76_17360 [Nitrospirota bacterium]|nr:hypothetical protein [Nitrospirota bacterium]